ncbi:MAG TPA: ABC transporter permease [Ferruginibacter sp.]|nr:ABC transporter permease [Ferruginibacter sp.]
MSKVGLIIGREYFTRVKKKSFLITTILVPLLIMAFYAIIIIVAIKGGNSSDSGKLAIIDEAGLFNDSALSSIKQKGFELVKNETETSFVGKYKDKGYSGFLYIPKVNIEKPEGIVLHSQSSISLTRSNEVSDLVNNAVEDKRLAALGINPEDFKKLSANVSIQNTIDTKEGGKKTVAGISYAVSYLCGILIYLMMIIYGTQVMRGVTEEKTNRISEVVISSVKPFDLMMGKIIGIGAVGLTQFAIWIVLFVLLQGIIPLLMPDILNQAGNAASAPEASSSIGVMKEITNGLSTLPMGKIIGWFMFYFLGGYLTYASLFAAVGSVVSEDQQEAQQLVFPILMPIILGFVIMTNAVQNPDSNLALFGSLFPLTSPVVMMGRITYDIPLWQLLVSAVLLIGTFILLTWLTAKIYRIGILMYGKKPSWKEMMKWVFRKS